VHERGRFGGGILGIFGAVLVAGQVATVLVLEGVHGVPQVERRQQGGFKLACPMHQFAAVAAAQPQPQRRGCRGHVHPRAAHRRQLAQPVEALAERLHQRQADAGNHLLAVHLLTKPRQGGPDIGTRGKIKVQIQRQPWRGQQDAALCRFHDEDSRWAHGPPCH